MKKVYAVVLLVVDHDNLGECGVCEALENTRYLVAPSVMAIETREVEWRDDHPLNMCDEIEAEFARLFGDVLKGGAS